MKKTTIASLIASATLIPLATAQFAPTPIPAASAASQPSATPQAQTTQGSAKYQVPDQMPGKPQTQVQQAPQGQPQQGQQQVARKAPEPIIISKDVLPGKLSPPIPIVRESVDTTVQFETAQVMTDAQINDVKRTVQRARQAQSTPFADGVVPKPINRPILIKPDSITEPPIVRLMIGTMTTFRFSDRDGNPWNIKTVKFNKQLFDSPDGAQGSQGNGQNAEGRSVFDIQTLEPFAYGNIKFEMESVKGAPPVTFTMMLSASQNPTFDNQIDVRIQGRNPGVQQGVSGGSSLPKFRAELENFLYYQAPPEAKKLKVDDEETNAWAFSDATIIRTRHSIISPAFIDQVGSFDGIKVYRMQGQTPSVLISINGKATPINLTGF